MRRVVGMKEDIMGALYTSRMQNKIGELKTKTVGITIS